MNNAALCALGTLLLVTAEFAHGNTWSFPKKHHKNEKTTYIHSTSGDKTPTGGDVWLHLYAKPKDNCIPYLLVTEINWGVNPYATLENANLRLRVDRKEIYRFRQLRLHQTQEPRKKPTEKAKFRATLIVDDKDDTDKGQNEFFILRDLLAGANVHIQISKDFSWKEKTYSWSLVGFNNSHEALIAACNRVAEQLKPVPSMDDTDICKDTKEDPWS